MLFSSLIILNEAKSTNLELKVSTSCSSSAKTLRFNELTLVLISKNMYVHNKIVAEEILY